MKVVEAFSDHLIGIADDDESLIVDLFDDGFELIDLLRFYASEQNLTGLAGVHAFAFDQGNAARAVFEEVVGDFVAETGDDIAQFGTVDAHDDNIVCFSAYEDKDEGIEDGFRVIEGKSACQNDGCVEDGDPNGDAEEFEPMIDFACEQFRTAAGDLKFDKDTQADALEDAAIDGGEDAIGGHAWQGSKELVADGQDGDGN